MNTNYRIDNSYENQNAADSFSVLSQVKFGDEEGEQDIIVICEDLHKRFYEGPAYSYKYDILWRILTVAYRRQCYKINFIGSIKSIDSIMMDAKAYNDGSVFFINEENHPYFAILFHEEGMFGAQYVFYTINPLTKKE